MQSCIELLTILLASKDYNKGNVKGTNLEFNGAKCQEGNTSTRALSQGYAQR